MTGRACVAVPGFRAVPARVQEHVGRGSTVQQFRGTRWSQSGTIVPDSYVPDQERSRQEREKARHSAAFPFLIPDVPEKLSGTIFLRKINALVPVPGFLPSLERGGGSGTAPLKR
jgi:hypothetical protein